MNRPDWKEYIDYEGIGWTRNVHFDKKINEIVKNIEIPYYNYPDEYNLYKSISEYYDIDMSNLTISNGGTDAIERLIRLLDFDNIVIIEPTFEMVRVYSELYGKNIINLEDDIPENTLLYYANPNGRDGQLYSPSHDKFKYVIIDEAYTDFCPKYSLMDKLYDHEIIVKTFSKSIGIAGLRCGFIVASEDITNHIQMFRQNHVVNSAACAILPRIINEIPNVVSRMEEGRNFLKTKFELIDTYTNFVIFKEDPTLVLPTKKVETGYRMALGDVETLNELIN